MSFLGSLPPDVLFGVALPLLWGAVFWLVAFPLWGRKSRPDVLIFGILLPFLFAIVGLRELPPLPPVAAEGWLFYLGIFAVAAHAAVWGICGARGRCYTLSVLGSILVAAACVYPLWQSGAYTQAQALETGAAIMFLSFFLQSCLQTVAARDARDGAWLAFFLSAGLAVLLIFSGSAYLGLLVGTAAAALGPSLLLGFFRKDLSLPANAAGALGMILSAGVAEGYLYANMPLDSAMLFAVSPGLCAFGPGLRRQFAAACFLALALLLAAIPYFEL